MAKVMAVIKRVRCGVGDHGVAYLQFTTFISECEAALQIFLWEEAKAIIEAANVSDVNHLEGKTCWVECEKGPIKFKGILKII